MKELYVRAFRANLFGAFAIGGVLFVAAGTVQYWQAWVFLVVFVGASALATIYLAIHDPGLLERRMRGGPTAEKEKRQKIIMSFAMIGFIALLVVPALDHRFGWSDISYAALIGDGLVAISFLLVFFVLKANTYSAATIQITEGQSVISTGPYAIVRHPMYAGSLPMVIGVPLALGSWWGLAALVVFLPALIWRLLDEERFLRKNLPGYTEYMDKVRYRLIPYVW